MAIDNYRAQAMDALKLFFPNLRMDELAKAIDWSIENNAKDNPSEIYNDYKDIKVNTTVFRMTQYILSKQPIVTAHGVIFQNHNSGVLNPLSLQLKNYFVNRKRLKETMFTYEPGTELYERYDLAQLLKKLSMNSVYGLLGLNTSYFYNLNLAASVTRMGKASISNAILLAEALFDNNVHFSSLDDIVGFITNVINEPRHYKDSDMLDRDRSVEECLYKIMMTTGFNGYIPTDEDCDIIYNMLMGLTQEDINRLYYKNNIYEFMDNTVVTNALVLLLKMLDKPWLDPNSPPKEIQVELDVFIDMISEYVYYRHLFTDKIEHAALMIKNVSVLTDTDSTFISLDAPYRYTLNKLKGVDLKIVDQTCSMGAFMEEGEVKVVKEEKVFKDYNFFTDEFMQVKRAVDPDVIIPQDGLRHSINSIMLYMFSKLSTDYMRVFSAAYGSFDDERCLLVLKNELSMRRVLIQTEARKHYCYDLEMKEGHPIPNHKRINLTGMEIGKSSLQKEVRARLKRILAEDILLAGKIDQRKLLVDMIEFERDIAVSLANGETKYYKPKSFKSIDSYDNPMSEQIIKAAIVYNETRDPGSESFNFNEKNGSLLFKVKINIPIIEQSNLKEENPKVYDALIKLLSREPFDKAGITSYCIPYDTEPPKWIIPFIDYNAMINDNLKAFPWESVGLVGRAGNDSVNHSNVLQII